MDGSLPVLALTFIALLAAGIAAWRVGEHYDREFRPPPAQDDAWPIVHPRSTLILAAAYLSKTPWAFVPVMLVVVIAALAFDLPPWFVGVPMGAFMAAIPLCLAIVLVVRCQQCQRRMLFQEISDPPFLEAPRGDHAWTSMMTRIATERRLRCMYCGQQHVIGRRDAM